MTARFCLSVAIWLMAVAFMLGGLGLFVAKIANKFEGSWWWIIWAFIGFILCLGGMVAPVLLALRRD